MTWMALLMDSRWRVSRIVVDTSHDRVYECTAPHEILDRGRGVVFATVLTTILFFTVDCRVAGLLSSGLREDRTNFLYS